MNRKKIKVLEIVTRLNIGGPAVNVIYITALLDKNNFDVCLVSGKESEFEGNMFYLCEQMNVKPLLVPQLQRELNLKNDLTALLKLIKIILKFKPDIIHTHTAKAGALGRLAGILCFKKNIIHTFHGHIFDGYFSPLKTKIFHCIEIFLSRFTKRIISVSETQRKIFKELKLGDFTKIICVPLGLQLDEFKNAVSLRLDMRNKFGFKENTIVISIIARIVQIKNHSLLIDAVNLLSEKFTDFKIVIVGDGDMRDEIVNKIQSLKLEKYFLFAGFTKELAGYYGMSDIVVLTSNNEGLPTVIIEAQAAGIPVISTNVGGVRDLIIENETGILAPAQNKEILAEKIFTLCSDSGLRKKLGIAGQKHALKNFSVQRLIYNFEKLYGELTEQLEKE